MPEHFRRHDKPRADHARQRSIKMPRHRPDHLTRVETILNGRAHDAEGLAGERLGACAELQVREQALLRLLHHKHRRRHGHIFRFAGAPARLRVEHRLLHRQRLHTGAALIVDIGAQRLVVLHGHAGAECGGVANLVEAILAGRSACFDWPRARSRSARDAAPPRESRPGARCGSSVTGVWQHAGPASAAPERITKVPDYLV